MKVTIKNGMDYAKKYLWQKALDEKESAIKLQNMKTELDEGVIGFLFLIATSICFVSVLKDVFWGKDAVLSILICLLCAVSFFVYDWILRLKTRAWRKKAIKKQKELSPDDYFLFIEETLNLCPEDSWAREAYIELKDIESLQSENINSIEVFYTRDNVSDIFPDAILKVSKNDGSEQLITLVTVHNIKSTTEEERLVWEDGIVTLYSSNLQFAENNQKALDYWLDKITEEN